MFNTVNEIIMTFIKTIMYCINNYDVLKSWRLLRYINVRTNHYFYQWDGYSLAIFSVVFIFDFFVIFWI